MVISGIGLLTLLSGCRSTEVQQEQASQRADIHQLQEKIGHLQGDIQSVQSENEDLRNEVSRLKTDLSTTQDSNTQYQKDIERLDTLIKKLDTVREQDRKIIVDEVSQEISRLSKKIQGPSESNKSKSANPPGEENTEHVVVKGETLTSIAKTYSISVKALMEANGLTKPDLKIGQKLLVPKATPKK